jgi:C4-dicarboxylate-specific signal transduction histidine kinase
MSGKRAFSTGNRTRSRRSGTEYTLVTPRFGAGTCGRAQNPVSIQPGLQVIHEDRTILHVVAIGQLDLALSRDFELEGIITDMTEQKATEQALTDAQAELARAARLASLGELAGSIIHEVSQPLTGMIASAESCLRWLARNPAQLDEARQSVMRIVEEGRRASSVIKGLRSLVREGQLQFADVQINGAIEEVLLLLQGELQCAAIGLRTNLDSSIYNIEADKVQLQQVVLNLVRNAIDAMVEVEGRVRMLTVISTLADGYATVAIADTGMGINPTISDRLFEALYTTKVGGLGLGLSICRKIIAAHGGRLWVEQNTRHGATFTFTVPVRQRNDYLESN